MSKPPQIFFFFLSGSKKGKIESADAQVVRIGRQPYCELKLDPHQDIPASGEHCHVIREEDGSYFVLDSGSTFGTWLNGTRIQGRVKLATGDVIECGKDEAGGREGPRLKFYLEEDVRKCPVCDGPVYKRHFKCPDCNRKTCLRCIDFTKKVCTKCAALAPGMARSSGFEVVEDDNVRGKRPAKVVLSGKEAAKVKKKQAEKEAAKPKGKPDGIGKGAPRKDDLSVPFCLICQDFVKGNPFVCPACGREICSSHKQGKVCMPCAGVSPDPVGKKTRAIMPTPTKGTKIAQPIQPAGGPTAKQLEEDDLEAEPILAETVPASNWGPAQRPSPVPRTEDAAPPATVRGKFIPPEQSLTGAQKKGTSEIKSSMPPPVKTGVATCARCRGPLGAGTFCCRACRRIMCFAHVAVDDVCEDCYLEGKDRGGAPAATSPATPPSMPRGATPFFPPEAGPPGNKGGAKAPGGTGALPERPAGHKTKELPSSTIGVGGLPAGVLPPEWDSERGATISEIEALDMMPLLDTEREEDVRFDDDLARPPPGTSSDDHTGLTGLSFVCPHCDAPLDAAARACPRCRKVL